MGKKAERIVLENLTAALESLGVVKVAHLLSAAVEDTEALEDGLFDVSAKREAQFAKGIALIIKARKGAKRDDREEEEEDDECDCCRSNHCSCEKPDMISVMQPMFLAQSKERVMETQATFFARLHVWTGLHFSSLRRGVMVSYKPKKLIKKMRKCEDISDLAALLCNKTGGGVTIRESKNGVILPGYRTLTNCAAAYYVTLR